MKPYPSRPVDFLIASAAACPPKDQTRNSAEQADVKQSDPEVEVADTSNSRNFTGSENRAERIASKLANSKAGVN